MLKKFIAVVVIAFVVRELFVYIEWLNLFEHTFNHRPGECFRLQGIEDGSEDMQLLPNGLAFISSGYIALGRETSELFRHRVGKIFLFDFNNPKKPPERLKIVTSDGKEYELISPLALGLWIDKPTGTTFLFVSRLKKNDMIVDKFLFDETARTLTHVRRIPQQPEFHAFNDLVLVGEDQFFYSNFMYTNNFLEMLLGVRWGSLGFFDGQQATLLDTGLNTPNGVALSPDGKFLYVACSCSREILVYNRHTNNSISFDNAFNIGTIVDNLIVDEETGDLWCGAHAVSYKALRYMDDPTNIAPSQVLRVKMSNGKPVNITEIFFDDGSLISASSVALRRGRGLLIGSINTHAVYCELDQKNI